MAVDAWPGMREALTRLWGPRPKAKRANRVLVDGLRAPLMRLGAGVCLHVTQ